MPLTSHAELADTESATLATYLSWLRRRWWILALFAALGAAASLVVTQMQPREFTTTALVLVTPIGIDQSVKVNLDTEAQVLRSQVVAVRAGKIMGTAIPAEQLVPLVTVTVPPNSQVLEVAFQAATPELAQAGAHAFAQAYLDLKLDDGKRRLENEMSALKSQIADVQKQLETTTGKIAAAPANSVDKARGEAERNVLTNQLTLLNSRLSPLLATALDPGKIISDARLPEKPSSPDQTLNLASGFGAGLLFGLVLALLLDRLDTRVRRGRDITDRLGLPLLLELPGKAHALSLLPPTHRASRELGRLRNVLLSTVPEPADPERGRVLLVSNLSAGTAGGYVVGNLAAAYARTGLQVAVVTTKPDSPLTQMVGAERSEYSLTDVLRRDVTALKALSAAPGVPHLRVLLPGDLDADEELPVAAMVEVLTALAARFDHVLVETASPTVAVEAQALASHVNAVIVVAESGRTRSGEVAAALRQFEQVDAQVLGAVLAPRMPAVKKAKKAAAAPQSVAPEPVVKLDDQPDVETTQLVARRKSAAAKDRKAMLVLPRPGESTVVLPRIKEIAKRDDSLPMTGNGQSPAKDSNGKGRLRVALDSGEDQG